MIHGTIYGYTRFDPDIVDQTHIDLCPGCGRCEAAWARWERAANRRYPAPAY